jgi:transcriptional regulator GlxA family with amidase domain
MKRRVGFFVFDGMTSLDLTGPQDAFMNAIRQDGLSAYETVVYGIDHRPVRCESGLRVIPDASLEQARDLDTFIIPGGAGLRELNGSAALIAWLTRAEPRIRRVASVCTGVFPLAMSGMLDGRKASTHWRFARELQRRFPKVKIEVEPIFTVDGKFWTSAGCTAGIDMSLAMIEADLGHEMSLEVARELVVYLKRPGTQSQFSSPLKAQVRATEDLPGIEDFILANLSGDLNLEILAEKCSMSVRQFARLFQRTFHESPAKMIEALRLNHAKLLLSNSKVSISSVAMACGFHNSDSFRRAFARRFGITPSDFQESFSARNLDRRLNSGGEALAGKA